MQTSDLVHKDAGVFFSRSGKNSWLQTGNGGRVSVLAPLQKEIKIEDIAKSLAKQCRFNGHCEEFYSVAEHCVRGVDLIELLWGDEAHFENYDLNIIKRSFLLHDASEAYIGDMIKPVKVMDPIFNEIEAKFEKVIQAKFKLDPDAADAVKYIDKLMLVWEKRDLLPHSEEWPNLPSIDGFNLPVLVPMNWYDAEDTFLNRYYNLFNVPQLVGEINA